MTKEEYLEFIRQQPYDALGDYGGFKNVEINETDSHVLDAELGNVNKQASK